MVESSLRLRDSRCLVTGCAGFIGSHLSHRLLDQGAQVQGIDNLNAYYDPKWKFGRLSQLEKRAGFSFRKLDIADADGIADLFSGKFDFVFHLASQAGVRHSVDHPYDYIDGNLKGTVHVLENCRRAHVKHFLFASTSSVYGLDSPPFGEGSGGDHPASLYAATKRAGEMMAHSYAHLFALPCSCLRFFTVYGPWGRPDMIPFLFARALEEGFPIPLFADGAMLRDFTFIDDVVESIVRVAERPPVPREGVVDDRASSTAPWRALNVGGERPVEVRRFLELLSQAMDRPANIDPRPAPPGDVWETRADPARLVALTGFRPSIALEDGIVRFVQWWKTRPIR
jgi:UDP-glucuronate 4-epimerase